MQTIEIPLTFGTKILILFLFAVSVIKLTFGFAWESMFASIVRSDVSLLRIVRVPDREGTRISVNTRPHDSWRVCVYGCHQRRGCLGFGRAGKSSGFVWAPEGNQAGPLIRLIVPLKPLLFRRRVLKAPDMSVYLFRPPMSSKEQIQIFIPQLLYTTLISVQRSQKCDTHRRDFTWGVNSVIILVFVENLILIIDTCLGVVWSVFHMDFVEV